MNYVVNKFAFLDKVSLFFRQRRMRGFIEMFNPGPDTRILDVGGYHHTWRKSGVGSRIHLLNIHSIEYVPLEDDPPFEDSVGDGCALPFEDKSWEIIFSNSVIEHLGTQGQQRAFAAEAMRVGKAFWIQTPSRWFFFEPHLMTPFLHYLPVGMRRMLMKNFSIWGWAFRPSPGEVDDFLAEVRLLTYREMQELFPGCVILRERFLGMTKSLIAVRRPGEFSGAPPPPSP